MIFKASFWHGALHVGVAIFLGSVVLGVIGIGLFALGELWMVFPGAAIVLCAFFGFCAVGGAAYGIYKEIEHRRRYKGRSAEEQRQAHGLPRASERFGVPTGFGPSQGYDQGHP